MLSFVQGTHSQVASGNISLAYGSTTTANSFLLASIQSANTTAAFTMSDPVNGAWTLLDSNNAILSQHWGLYYIPKNLGGNITVAVTETVNASFSVLEISEWTNQVQSGSPIDVFSVFNDFPSPATFGPVSTTVANDHMIFFGWGAASTAWTSSAGYTSRFDGNNTEGSVIADNGTIAVSTGSYSYTGTSATHTLFGWLLAVKSLAGGGGGGGGDLGPSYDFRIRI